MKMPKYVVARHAKGLSDAKVEQATNAYKARLIRLGILPGSDFWHYLVEENIVGKSCQLDMVVDIRGACSTSFVILGTVRKVRFTFHGLQDLECSLHNNGKCRLRRFLGVSIWKVGSRFHISIELSSGRDENKSVIAFSYQYVLSECERG